MREIGQITITASQLTLQQQADCGVKDAVSDMGAEISRAVEVINYYDHDLVTKLDANDYDFPVPLPSSEDLGAGIRRARHAAEGTGIML